MKRTTEQMALVPQGSGKERKDHKNFDLVFIHLKKADLAGKVLFVKINHHHRLGYSIGVSVLFLLLGL